MSTIIHSHCSPRPTQPSTHNGTVKRLCVDCNTYDEVSDSSACDHAAAAHVQLFNVRTAVSQCYDTAIGELVDSRQDETLEVGTTTRQGTYSFIGYLPTTPHSLTDIQRYDTE